MPSETSIEAGVLQSALRGILGPVEKTMLRRARVCRNRGLRERAIGFEQAAALVGRFLVLTVDEEETARLVRDVVTRGLAND